MRFGRRASDRLPAIADPPLSPGGVKTTLIGLAVAAVALALAIAFLVTQK